MGEKDGGTEGAYDGNRFVCYTESSIIISMTYIGKPVFAHFTKKCAKCCLAHVPARENDLAPAVCLSGLSGLSGLCGLCGLYGFYGFYGFSRPSDILNNLVKT